MGASSGIQAGEQASAEALLDAFKTIDGSGRAKHSAVLDYWLAIRGSKELPPLRDLDPLEISDAGPTITSFKATPPVIMAGEASTLFWEVANATSIVVRFPDFDAACCNFDANSAAR